MDISICIICHLPKDEHSDMLDMAIESAAAQRFDGTYEIIIQREPLTMPENTNKAVQRAKGEYIKWLHYDDLLTVDSLQILWGGRGADVIVGDVLLFGEDYGMEDHFNYLPADLSDFVNRNPINQVGLMYRRDVLLNEPLDETLWTAEEYELNLRLWANGYKFVKVDGFVGKYRIHPAMKSGSAWLYKDDEMKKRRREVIETIKNIYR